MGFVPEKKSSKQTTKTGLENIVGQHSVTRFCIVDVVVIVVVD